MQFDRNIDSSWNYKNSNTKTHTHGIHKYPAMFIPQIANRLIKTYSKRGDIVCDIFCGSGTSLVEARLSGRNAYGIDLNPLAILIAKTKTAEINPKLLTNESNKLIEKIKRNNKKNNNIPDFKNINFWFKPEVISDLSCIKAEIDKIKNKKIKSFFLIAFSEIVRQSSNTKNSEFKLVRMKSPKLELHSPDVIKIFEERLYLNIQSMAEYYSDVDKNTWVKIIEGNSSKPNTIKSNSIDFILTSPPYGDSQTTVAYGQFSRLSTQWIGIYKDPNEAMAIDKSLLGGVPPKELIHSLDSIYLQKIIKSIKAKDEKRAKEVLGFFNGLNQCMKQAYLMLKKDKYFTVVIGNRLVKQIRIPTDFIVAELGQKIGFNYKEIIVRDISNKRMPSKNSPTNIAGILEKTIQKESILIFKK